MFSLHVCCLLDVFFSYVRHVSPAFHVGVSDEVKLFLFHRFWSCFVSLRHYFLKHSFFASLFPASYYRGLSLLVSCISLAFGFAWIMAVAQRVNPALIFPATLKATELTDGRTELTAVEASRHALPHREVWRLGWCGGTRCQTIITFTRFRVTTAMQQEPSPWCCTLEPLLFCVYEYLRTLWRHWMPQSDVSAAVLLMFVSMFIPWRLIAKCNIGIQKCVGVSECVKKVLESAFVHEYQLCRALFPDRETGKQEL